MTGEMNLRKDANFVQDDKPVVPDKEKVIDSFKKLSNHVGVNSILDLYEKVKRNAPDLKPPTREEQIKIALNLQK